MRLFLIVAYRTSSPVTARPMIIRWVSDVPSKIAKILHLWAVSACQRPVGPVVSARIQHGLFEMNDGFRRGNYRRVASDRSPIQAGRRLRSHPTTRTPPAPQEM
jgi:hypothetical protein